MKRKNLSLQNQCSSYIQLEKTSNKIGPQLKRPKLLDIGRKVKKLIHYDCKLQEDLNDDVPDEEEVFVKENLLKRFKEEEEANEEELGMVNVNVSVLVSEAEEKNEILDETENEFKTECDMSKKNNYQSHHNAKTILEEDLDDEVEIDKPNPQINVYNINIDHRKNVISESNLKSSHRKDEKMVRDIKSLHLITQKALLNISKRNNDNIDVQEKASFHNFKSNSLNLYVSDHSDYPVGYNNEQVSARIPIPNNKRKRKDFSAKEQEPNVINIINVNNNYTIGAIVLSNSNKSDRNHWRSPLDDTILHELFKTYTPQNDKNFNFKQFSLIPTAKSFEKIPSLGNSKKLPKISLTKGRDLKQILSNCKEKKYAKTQQNKNFIKFK